MNPEDPIQLKQDRGDEIDLEDLIQQLVVANTIRDAYLKDAASAASLCKNRGGKRKKEVTEVG